jgi:hypothetical protein
VEGFSSLLSYQGILLTPFLSPVAVRLHTRIFLPGAVAHTCNPNTLEAEISGIKCEASLGKKKKKKKR